MDCLGAQDALSAESLRYCGFGKHVCLVPLGKVSPDLVRNLVDYYYEQYGLRIGVLTPTAIPEELVNKDRNQVDALALGDFMQGKLTLNPFSPGPPVIGLASVDLYLSTKDWFWAFGVRDFNPVMSTCRMNPVIYGESENDELTFSRARKLLSKYIGQFYYHLPLSDDPESPMFNNILSPLDLDQMAEPLPVESYGHPR